MANAYPPTYDMSNQSFGPVGGLRWDVAAVGNRVGAAITADRRRAENDRRYDNVERRAEEAHQVRMREAFRQSVFDEYRRRDMDRQEQVINKADSQVRFFTGNKYGLTDVQALGVSLGSLFEVQNLYASRAEQLAAAGDVLGQGAITMAIQSSDMSPQRKKLTHAGLTIYESIHKKDLPDVMNMDQEGMLEYIKKNELGEEAEADSLYAFTSFLNDEYGYAAVAGSAKGAVAFDQNQANLSATEGAEERTRLSNERARLAIDMQRREDKAVPVEDRAKIEQEINETRLNILQRELRALNQTPEGRDFYQELADTFGEKLLGTLLDGSRLDALDEEGKEEAIETIGRIFDIMTEFEKQKQGRDLLRRGKGTKGKGTNWSRGLPLTDPAVGDGTLDSLNLLTPEEVKSITGK